MLNCRTDRAVSQMVRNRLYCAIQIRILLLLRFLLSLFGNRLMDDGAELRLGWSMLRSRRNSLICNLSAWAFSSVHFDGFPCVVLALGYRLIHLVAGAYYFVCPGSSRGVYVAHHGSSFGVLGSSKAVSQSHVHSVWLLDLNRLALINVIVAVTIVIIRLGSLDGL